MGERREVLFPNGGSFCEMRIRVLNAFEAIQRKHDGQTTASVSHGGVNRIVLADALQIPDKYIFRVAQDYGAVNLLALMYGFQVVQLLNQRHPMTSVSKRFES